MFVLSNFQTSESLAFLFHRSILINSMRHGHRHARIWVCTAKWIMYPHFPFINSLAPLLTNRTRIYPAGLLNCLQIRAYLFLFILSTDNRGANCMLPSLGLTSGGKSPSIFAAGRLENLELENQNCVNNNCDPQQIIPEIRNLTVAILRCPHTHTRTFQHCHK